MGIVTCWGHGITLVFVGIGDIVAPFQVSSSRKSLGKARVAEIQFASAEIFRSRELDRPCLVILDRSRNSSIEVQNRIHAESI